MKLLIAVLFVCLLGAAGSTVLQNIEAEPVIALSSGSGNVGMQVSVSGSGFLPTDTTCTFSSPSSPSLVISAACVTTGGSLAGGFTVGNVLPGAYVVQASGNEGDFAQALLQIDGGAQMGLSGATGEPGSDVSFRGVGFLPTDTTCTISSPSSPNPILTGTAACTIQAGSGTPQGSFIIGNVLPGQYVIQLTGNQGDSAQAILAVE